MQGNRFIVAINHEYKENRQYKFHTVVSEVSSFVGSPVGSTLKNACKARQTT